jgi:hypothetical protein
MNRFFKYLSLAVAILVFIWFVGVLSVYFFINVEDVQNKFTEVVNKNTNGHVEMSNLKIRFFPIVCFKLDNLNYYETKSKRKELMKAKNLDFSLNLWSFFTGSIDLNLGINKLDLNIVKKGNFTNLEKSLNLDKKENSNKEKIKEENLSTFSTEDYLFASIGTVNINVKDSNLNYKDNKNLYKIDNFNLKITLKPSDRHLEINSVFPLDLKKEDFLIKGDLKVYLDLLMEGKNSFVLSSVVDMTKLKIKSSSLYKSPKTKLVLSLEAQSDLNNLDIKKANLKFEKDFLSISGKIKDIKNNPYLNLELKTKSYNLFNLSKLIKDFKIEGFLSLDTLLKGNLKPMPIVSLDLNYKDGKKSDLNLKLLNTKKNKNTFYAEINSKKFTFKSSAVKDENNKQDKNKVKLNNKKQDDYIISKKDFNEIKKLKYEIIFKTYFKHVVLDKINLYNTRANFNLSKRGFFFKPFTSNIFSGIIKSDFNIDTSGLKPLYDFNLLIKNLKVESAINDLMPDLKGVLNGILNTELKLKSNGFTKKTFSKKLLGRGDFSFKDFKYSKKVFKNDITGLINNKIGIKNPINLSKIVPKDITWKSVVGVFNINNEFINIKKLDAINKPYKIKGSGKIKFNQKMDFFFDLITPYSKMPYDYLKYDKNEAMLPLRVKGTVNSPKIDPSRTTKYISKKLIKKETSKAKKKIKKKLKDNKKAKKIMNMLGF